MNDSRSLNGQRIPDLRAQLRERGLGAVLITHPSNRFYLSGFRAGDTPPDESAGALLVTGERSYLVTAPLNVEQAKAQAESFEIVPRGQHLDETLATLLREHEIRRLGYEEDALLVRTYHALANRLGAEVELVPVGGLASDLRVVKSEDEIAKIAAAAKITDQAFEAVWPRMSPEHTERQVAWELAREMHDRGADDVAFPVIVASGPNGARPHHEPTDRPIGEGLPITIDMGARLDGYNADLTRTVILGEPTARSREVYAVVLRAEEAALAGIAAGITGAAADSLARDVIVAAGFGDFFPHGLGHGIGVRVHEAPRAGQTAPDPLPLGATLTIEPGIYIPDWGGVRIEDLVVVEEAGVRQLSHAAKQRVS